jgi:hydrogenase maturation protease
LNKKYALIGIGNIMFSDDGLGIYAAEYIRRNYETTENLTILDGGGLGFTLMTYFQEYDKVYILSTTSMEGKSGDVATFSKEELIAQGQTRQSANEVEVVMMLEICSVLDEEMSDIEIITMKPHDIVPVETTLTPQIRKYFPRLINATLEALKRDGLNVKRKKVLTSLEDILYGYANPTQQIHI